MKNRILLIVLAVVICLSSLSMGLYITATEPTETKTPSEMFDKELIYTEFENVKIAETSISPADWKSFVSYSHKDSNWSDWENTDDFTLPCDRCLKPVEQSVILEFAREVLSPELVTDEDTKEDQHFVDE